MIFVLLVAALPSAVGENTSTTSRHQTNSLTLPSVTKPQTRSPSPSATTTPPKTHTTTRTKTSRVTASNTQLVTQSLIVTDSFVVTATKRVTDSRSLIETVSNGATFTHDKTHSTTIPATHSPTATLTSATSVSVTPSRLTATYSSTHTMSDSNSPSAASPSLSTTRTVTASHSSTLSAATSTSTTSQSISGSHSSTLSAATSTSSTSQSISGSHSSTLSAATSTSTTSQSISGSHSLTRSADSMSASYSLSQTESVSLSPPYFAPPYYRILYQHAVKGFNHEPGETIYNTTFEAMDPPLFQRVVFSSARTVVLLNDSFSYSVLQNVSFRLVATVPSHEDAPWYLLAERKEPMTVITWVAGDGGPQHQFTFIEGSWVARWYVDSDLKTRGGSATATFSYPSITTNPVVAPLTYYLNVIENQPGALLQVEPMLGRVDALWTWRRIVDGVNVLSAYVRNFRLEIRPGKCVKASNSTWASRLYDDSVGGLHVYYFNPLAEEGYVPIPLIEDPTFLTVRDPATGLTTAIDCSRIVTQLMKDDEVTGTPINVSDKLGVANSQLQPSFTLPCDEIVEDARVSCGLEHFEDAMALYTGGVRGMMPSFLPQTICNQTVGRVRSYLKLPSIPRVAVGEDVRVSVSFPDHSALERLYKVFVCAYYDEVPEVYKSVPAWVPSWRNGVGNSSSRATSTANFTVRFGTTAANLADGISPDTFLLARRVSVTAADIAVSQVTCPNLPDTNHTFMKVKAFQVLMLETDTIPAQALKDEISFHTLLRPAETGAQVVEVFKSPDSAWSQVLPANPSDHTQKPNASIASTYTMGFTVSRKLLYVHCTNTSKDPHFRCSRYNVTFNPPAPLPQTGTYGCNSSDVATQTPYGSLAAFLLDSRNRVTNLSTSLSVWFNSTALCDVSLYSPSSTELVSLLRACLPSSSDLFTVGISSSDASTSAVPFPMAGPPTLHCGTNPGGCTSITSGFHSLPAAIAPSLSVLATHATRINISILGTWNGSVRVPLQQELLLVSGEYCHGPHIANYTLSNGEGGINCVPADGGMGVFCTLYILNCIEMDLVSVRLMWADIILSSFEPAGAVPNVTQTDVCRAKFLVYRRYESYSDDFILNHPNTARTYLDKPRLFVYFQRHVFFDIDVSSSLFLPPLIDSVTGCIDLPPATVLCSQDGEEELLIQGPGLQIFSDGVRGANLSTYVQGTVIDARLVKRVRLVQSYSGLTDIECEVRFVGISPDSSSEDPITKSQTATLTLTSCLGYGQYLGIVALTADNRIVAVSEKRLPTPGSGVRRGLGVASISYTASAEIRCGVDEAVSRHCGAYGVCDINSTQGGGCICPSNNVTGFWEGESCSICLSGYNSTNCTIPCPAHSCSGNGFCWNGACSCFPEFGGQNCSSTCPGTYVLVSGVTITCNGHGTCNPTTLTCSCQSSSAEGFFTGDSCGQCTSAVPAIFLPDCRPFDENAAGRVVPPNNCTLLGCFNGTCIDGNCVCSTGYCGASCNSTGCTSCSSGRYGPSCSGVCDGITNSTPCNGRGYCSNTDSSPNGVCFCNGNFASGTGCARGCPVGPTGTAVCSGKGQCDSVTGTCRCDPFAAGTDCSLNCTFGLNQFGDLEVCSGHGTCRHGQGGDGGCECKSGFFGSACSSNCTALVSPAGVVCSGHGDCSTGGRCLCQNSESSGFWDGKRCDSCMYGYYGVDCTSKCPNGCSGHGRCDDKAGCLCTQSESAGFWGGSDCGSCVAGYFGPICRTECPGGACNPCNGNGICNFGVSGSGTCDCYVMAGSLNGTTFDNYTDPTVYNASSGGIPMFRGLTCSGCVSGRYGETCDKKCPYVLVPASQTASGVAENTVCGGHGTCSDGQLGSGRCTCQSGYEGGNCNVCSSLLGFAQIYSTDSKGVAITDTAIRSCAQCTLKCSNRGVCVAGTSVACSCNVGYGGSGCQYQCLFNGAGTCGGRGLCTSSGCFCPYPFQMNPATKLCTDCVGTLAGPYCNLTCPDCGFGSCNVSTGKCNCLSGFWGDTCTFQCPGGAANPCNGNGVCSSTTGLCTCNSSLTGGYFIGPECDMCSPAYQSERCNIPCPISLGKMCSGRGTCFNGACYQCERNLVIDSAGAIVIYLSNISCGTACDRSASYCLPQLSLSYICPAGSWGAPACANDCPRDTSTGAICSAHGACQSLTGVCVCETGYAGDLCQYSCPTREGQVCSSKGVCEVQNGVATCQCVNGYSGSDCYGKCPGALDSGLLCSGNGRCEGSACICSTGYFGEACDGICPGGTTTPCSLHGQCAQATGECVCNSDPSTGGVFTGPTCSICADGYGGGTCTQLCSESGTIRTSGLGCLCDAKHGGPLCETQCYIDDYGSMCSGHGTCDSGTSTSTGICICFEGYFTEKCNVACSTQVCAETYGLASPQCNPTTGACECVSDGVRHFAGATCNECADGYWGSECSLPCACSGNGMCSRDEAACTCYTDDSNGHWAGDNCDVCAAAFMGPGCLSTNLRLSDYSLPTEASVSLGKSISTSCRDSGFAFAFDPLTDSHIFACAETYTISNALVQRIEGSLTGLIDTVTVTDAGITFTYREGISVAAQHAPSIFREAFLPRTSFTAASRHFDTLETPSAPNPQSTNRRLSALSPTSLSGVMLVSGLTVGLDTYLLPTTEVAAFGHVAPNRSNTYLNESAQRDSFFEDFFVGRYDLRIALGYQANSAQAATLTDSLLAANGGRLVMVDRTTGSAIMVCFNGHFDTILRCTRDVAGVLLCLGATLDDEVYLFQILQIEDGVHNLLYDVTNRVNASAFSLDPNATSNAAVADDATDGVRKVFQTSFAPIVPSPDNSTTIDGVAYSSIIRVSVKYTRALILDKPLGTTVGAGSTAGRVSCGAMSSDTNAPWSQMFIAIQRPNAASSILTVDTYTMTLVGSSDTSDLFSLSGKVIALSVRSASRTLALAIEVYSGGQVYFKVANVFGISSVGPSIVDAAGGTVITVHGSGFSSRSGAQFSCVFGTREDYFASIEGNASYTFSKEFAAVPMAVRSSTMGTCVAPAFPTTSCTGVPVSIARTASRTLVAGGSRDFSAQTVSSISNRLSNQVSIQRASSVRVDAATTSDAGPRRIINSRASITIQGNGFTSSPYARCRLFESVSGSVWDLGVAVNLGGGVAECEGGDGVPRMTVPPAYVQYSHDGAVYGPSGGRLATVGSPSSVAVSVGTTTESSVRLYTDVDGTTTLQLTANLIVALPTLQITVLDAAGNSVGATDTFQRTIRLVVPFAVSTGSSRAFSTEASATTSSVVTALTTLGSASISGLSLTKPAAQSALIPITSTDLATTYLKFVVVPGSPSQLILEEDVSTLIVGTHTSTFLKLSVALSDNAGNLLVGSSLAEGTVPNYATMEYRYLDEDRTVTVFQSAGVYLFSSVEVWTTFGTVYSLRITVSTTDPSSGLNATPTATFNVAPLQLNGLTLQKCTPEEEYGVVGTHDCLPCPLFATCDGSVVVRTEANHWRADPTSYDFYSCLPYGSCDRDGTCNKGFEGPRCSVCTDGYGRSGYSCFKCWAPYINWILIIVVCVALTAVIALLGHNTVTATGAQEATIVFKVITTHMQFVSIISLARQSTNEAGRDVESFQSSLSTINPGISFVSCEIAPDAVALFRITALLPVGLVFVLSNVAVAYALYRRKKDREQAALALEARIGRYKQATEYSIGILNKERVLLRSLRGKVELHPGEVLDIDDISTVDVAGGPSRHGSSTGATPSGSLLLDAGTSAGGGGGVLASSIGDLARSSASHPSASGSHRRGSMSSSHSASPTSRQLRSVHNTSTYDLLTLGETHTSHQAPVNASFLAATVDDEVPGPNAVATTPKARASLPAGLKFVGERRPSPFFSNSLFSSVPTDHESIPTAAQETEAASPATGNKPHVRFTEELAEHSLEADHLNDLLGVDGEVNGGAGAAAQPTPLGFRSLPIPNSRYSLADMPSRRASVERMDEGSTPTNSTLFRTLPKSRFQRPSFSRGSIVEDPSPRAESERDMPTFFRKRLEEQASSSTPYRAFQSFNAGQSGANDSFVIPTIQEPPPLSNAQGTTLARHQQGRQNPPLIEDQEIYVPEEIPLFLRDFRTGNEKHFVRLVVEVAIIFVIVGLFLLYPSVLQNSAKMLQCESIDYGADVRMKSFLIIDSSISCDDAEYDTVRQETIIALACYGLGVPLLPFFIVACYRVFLKSDEGRVRLLRFMTDGYRESTWWWESVNSTAKLALLGIAIFFSNVTLRLLALFWAFSLLGLIYYFAQPRAKTLPLARLAEGVQILLDVALCGAGLLAHTAGGAWVLPIDIIGTLINVGVTGCLIFLMLLAGWRMLQVMADANPFSTVGVFVFHMRGILLNIEQWRNRPLTHKTKVANETLRRMQFQRVAHIIEGELKWVSHRIAILSAKIARLEFVHKDAFNANRIKRLRSELEAITSHRDVVLEQGAILAAAAEMSLQKMLSVGWMSRVRSKVLGSLHTPLPDEPQHTDLGGEGDLSTTLPPPPASPVSRKGGESTGETSRGDHPFQQQPSTPHAPANVTTTHELVQSLRRWENLEEDTSEGGERDGASAQATPTTLLGAGDASRGAFHKAEDTVRTMERFGPLALQRLEGIANFYEVEEVVLERILRSIYVTHHSDFH